MSARPFTHEQQASVQRVRALAPTAYYAVLNVRADADDAAVRRAYKALALQLHPDKNGAPGAQEAFTLLGTAFAVLSDPHARAQYDSSTFRQAAYDDDDVVAEIQRRRAERARTDAELARLARAAAAAEADESRRRADEAFRARTETAAADAHSRQRLDDSMRKLRATMHAFRQRRQRDEARVDEEVAAAAAAAMSAEDASAREARKAQIRTRLEDIARRARAEAGAQSQSTRWQERVMTARTRQDAELARLAALAAAAEIRR